MTRTLALAQCVTLLALCAAGLARRDTPRSEPPPAPSPPPPAEAPPPPPGVEGTARRPIVVDTCSLGGVERPGAYELTLSVP